MTSLFRRGIGFCGLLATLIFMDATAGADPKVPRLESPKGSVRVKTARETELRPAKAGEVLREHALIEVEGGSVLLVLTEDRQVLLGPSSEVELPGIRWETGDVPVVRLIRGRLRWSAGSDGAEQGRVTSDLFDWPGQRGDFVLTFEPKTPEATLMVLNGTTTFRALNAEEQKTVKTGQKISFRGVLEEGEIAYDLLLKDRKIPRGRLGEAVPAPTAELDSYRLEREAEERAKTEARKKAQRKIEQERREGLICKDPGAKLNECAWVCRGLAKKAKDCDLSKAGVSCLRQRCNANGKWAEETVLDGEAASRCRVQPVVAVCDY